MRAPPEDYNKHWGFASYKDKSILDIGADWGSTAKYFLEQGAKSVVAVEGNVWGNYYIKELFENYDKNPKVKCIGMKIDSPLDFVYLIEKYKTDIVKVDIEGDEKYLLPVDKSIINSITEWIIEVHNTSTHNKFTGIFKELNYTLTTHFTRGQVSVIWARKTEGTK